MMSPDRKFEALSFLLGVAVVKGTAWIALFLITLVCAMRLWSLERWSFCECRKSPNNVACDEAVKLSRVSQALSVWPFSMILYWEVCTHPLSLCSLPVHSRPVAQRQQRTKNTTLLFSLYISLPFIPLFPDPPILVPSQTGIGQSTINPISTASRGTANPCRSRGGPAKFGGF